MAKDTAQQPASKDGHFNIRLVTMEDIQRAREDLEKEWGFLVKWGGDLPNQTYRTQFVGAAIECLKLSEELINAALRIEKASTAIEPAVSKALESLARIIQTIPLENPFSVPKR